MLASFPSTSHRAVSVGGAAIAYQILFLVLGGCSTSHQPVAMEPYFGFRQAGYSGRELLGEIRELERKAESQPLVGHEKKRLYDLYQAELTYLKPGSSRSASLTTLAAALKSESGKWDLERQEIERQSKEENKKNAAKTDPGPLPFAAQDLRKPYSEVVRLWNKELTPEALSKLESLMGNELKSAAPADSNKFLLVGFRIALEEGDLTRAGLHFNSMKNNEKCGYETSTAGFLYSLVLLGEKQDAQAKRIFDGLCSPDDSPAERIRRDYWRARMTMASDPERAKELLEKIADLPIPGYHTFFSVALLGRKYEIAPAAADQAPRPYLSAEISVSRSIHEDWLAAEERLRFQLRRDAQVFLARVSGKLRNHPNTEKVPAMLYTAHLFHASGNHLEAMRLYSEVASVLSNEGGVRSEWITPTVLGDMFPRPNSAKAEWASGLWEMDSDFVYAIARQESGFNPTAVSATDARGWMQLMPSLAKSIGRSWGLEGIFQDRFLFHVDENLKFGVFHLRQLQDLLGHPALIAGAYNAGASRALNWQRRYGGYPLDIFIELIPINETRNYIKLVLRNLFLYKALRLGSADPSFLSSEVRPGSERPSALVP